MNQFKQLKSSEQRLNVLSISNFQFRAKLALKCVAASCTGGTGDLFSRVIGTTQGGLSRLGCEQRQQGLKGMWKAGQRGPSL